MTIVTRFAPSPTGFLHIGGARTALFNYLHAKHHGGKFLLRVEDTDRKRSTEEATRAILDGMAWLGMDGDEPPVYQLQNQPRHAEIAHMLVERGKAYYCYTTAQELTDMRAEAEARGEVLRFRSPWRDGGTPPDDVSPSVRLKAPDSGDIVLDDAVQGEVSIPSSEVDDLVLLRADGTPTYMLAVVVDDHDMGVTDIIRGDDHFTNSFRQKVIYDALGWDMPKTAHIPLIHGSDGAKMSKRHGALGVDAYRDMGYLPQAMCNYLLRLGWSYGERDIISMEEACKAFDINAVGKSPSRFDMDKLNFINNHYIREMDGRALLAALLPFMEAVDTALHNRLERAALLYAERANTLVQLAQDIGYMIAKPDEYSDKARAMLSEEGAAERLAQMRDVLVGVTSWDARNIEDAMKEYMDREGLKLGKVAPLLRSAIAGTHQTPNIYDVLEIMGKDELLARLEG